MAEFESFFSREILDFLMFFAQNAEESLDVFEAFCLDYQSFSNKGVFEQGFYVFNFIENKSFCNRHEKTGFGLYREKL